MSAQGETYAKFIEAELKFEYDRRTVLDARGLAIVSSSSALLTLLVAVAALGLGKDFKLVGEGKAGVSIALACFFVAGVFGLLANRAREYEVTSTVMLRTMTADHWKDPEVDARNVCAQRNVITIASLRAGNDSKAGQITWGLGFQLAAIAALGMALLAQVLNG